MMTVMIIVILVLLIYAFYRARYTQHKVYAILLILLVLFVYVSGSRILAKNNVDIKSFNGMVTASKLYVNWLGQAFRNTKTIIGNVIKMEWGANSTTK